MNKISPRRWAEDVEGADLTIPWGIYIPPSIIAHEKRNIVAQTLINDAIPNNGQHHGGYVRIVDAKGKSFPCGFSRPVGHVIEAVVTGKKRNRFEMGGIKASTCKVPDELGRESEVVQRKKTITEERLHPEEALYLHLRGLLRIVSSHSEESEASERKEINRTLTTHDLFCNVLPDSNIPLAAYLAYAHLRAQGYILIRYTEQRMKLLCSLKNSSERPNQSSTLKETIQANHIVFSSTNVKETKPEESANISERRPINVDREVTSRSDEKCSSGDDGMFTTSSEERFRTRTLRLKLSDDVATAPPPCVVSLEGNECVRRPEIRLAYYAYNPNAHFKRSNPGLPDFGVAVMPFNDNQPSFDTLNSLVSMCEGAEDIGNTKSGIPLRVVTVADGGAVIAFGVTNGEVPSINQPKKGDS
ncbi:hypothetical protein ACHAW5_002749 [Stephanodiscus triporus]|uniref:tRNA-splicing endonuclease subunit Sen54 N-terminal domain-containing protein n=1 Tax=Stephanodiscus triporus TaxID=2934178 RepID=A0ABD3NJU5_9STRA